MGYTKDHRSSDCDKCLKRVGKKNLTKVPFLYLDKNDKVHKDMSPWMREQKRKAIEEQFDNQTFVELYMEKVKIESGYRQYYVCKDCKDNC